jgi:hypothetical protein
MDFATFDDQRVRLLSGLSLLDIHVHDLRRAWNMAPVVRKVAAIFEMVCNDM